MTYVYLLEPEVKKERWSKHDKHKKFSHIIIVWM